VLIILKFNVILLIIFVILIFIKYLLFYKYIMELISSIINFYEKAEYNTKEKFIDAFKLPIEYLDKNAS
jgi:hypothetical protein